MQDIKKIQVVSIIGAGSWGTSLAKTIASNHSHLSVRLWALEKEVAESINSQHENNVFLRGISLPENIAATSDLREAVEGADVVLIATPSKVVYECSQKISKYLSRNAHVGFLSKGFFKIHNEILTMGQTIERGIPFMAGRVIAVCGPSHAEEVSAQFHTCLNIAGKDPVSRKIIADLITCDYLQCRETDDILGVEIGSTLKNPAAIAAGIISILPKCGDNLSGALISEALKEMIRLARALNVREETLMDISGLGDLVATALSDHSRNRRFGKDIAEQIIHSNKALNLADKVMLKLKPEIVIERLTEKLNYLAEGAYAIEPIIELAEMKDVDIPVYRSLYEVLLNKKDPVLLVETIKNPEKFEEIYRKTKIQIVSRQKGLEKVTGKVFREQIVRNTVARFIGSGDQKTKQIHERERIINNCKKFLKETPFGRKRRGIKREIKILRKINRDNYARSVKLLSLYYANSIIDHFSSFFSRIFFKILRIFSFLSRFARPSGRVTVTGSIDKIRRIKTTDHIIYIPISMNHYDFMYILTAIDVKQMPFPRFFVNSNIIRRKRDFFLIRRAGGFIVDNIRLRNIIYKEALSQYVSAMIDNGVPLLYFPDHNLPRVNDKILFINEFFSSLYGLIFKHTVEIALVPIEVSYFRKSPAVDPDSISYKRIFRNDINVNFSEPVFMSDFTKTTDSIREIADKVTSIWMRDVKIFPHILVCKVLADNDFRLGIPEAEDLIGDIISTSYNNDILHSNAVEILSRGLKFLTSAGILTTDGDTIIVIKRGDILFYSRVMEYDNF